MPVHSATAIYWIVLAAFATVFLVATWIVVVRTTRRSMR